MPPFIPVLLSCMSNEYAYIIKILFKTNWFLYIDLDTGHHLKKKKKVGMSPLTF